MGALAGAVGGRVALLIAGAVAVGTAAVGWRSLARVVVTRPAARVAAEPIADVTPVEVGPGRGERTAPDRLAA